VGEILRAAADRGARQILVGRGGSATNDGGSGMARALGIRFLDKEEREINTVEGLQKLVRIVWPNERRLPPITALSDVRNPLLGPHGATRTFGPQKGATPDQLEILERALGRLAEMAAEEDRDFREVPGAGAAGGLGFGLMAFCRAGLRPGFEVVAEAIHLHDQIARADYVITGEGKMDRQTLEGKAPAGVAQMARKFGKPVFANVGRFTGDEEVRALFDGNRSLDNKPPDFPHTAELLAQRAQELAATWRAPA
jgi:glycerate kinase